MTTRILFIVLIAISGLCIPADAQMPGPSDSTRQRWLSEIRNYKHDFLTRELSLSKEQQSQFFPLYDAMEDEVERINGETRELEIRIMESENASDLEMENAARTIFEQKRAEGQVEMTYFEKFKEILSPSQLAKIKSAERRFTQRLVNEHRRLRGHGKRANRQ